MSRLEEVVSAINAVSSKPARRYGNEYRAQCPAHCGRGMNLNIKDSERRVLFTCYSHHCDPKDIMESIGLSIKDVFHEPLKTGQKRSQKKRAKTQRQIEDECVHAYLVLTQLPVMKYNGIVPTDMDVNAINDALAIIERYEFTDDDYLNIEMKRQEEVDKRRVIECDRALDDAYELFLLRGGDYAERS